MTQFDFYFLVSYKVKPTHMQDFRNYLNKHRDIDFTEYILTFTPIIGREGSNIITSLYKILDMNSWFKIRAMEYMSPEITEYCSDIEYTLLDKLNYSVLEAYMQAGEAASRENLNFFSWADIEVKSNRLADYHAYWAQTCIQPHKDMGSEMIATFNVISGSHGTTHVKRLFLLTDIEAWADGEVIFHDHDNKWSDLAHNVWTTEVYPEPYSHIR